MKAIPKKILLETESDWLRIKSRFNDYENGFVDSHSMLYNSRNIASTVSIDEIAEDWQELRNYFTPVIIEHTYSYLGYSLCAGRISFKKYHDLKKKIVLSDNDTTYSTCIRILREAGYA